MAAPSYTEDLTDIDLGESTTGWSQINFSGGGGAGLDFGPDLAMQGTNSVLRQVSGHERGAIYNNGSTTGAVATGVHIFQWLFIANPGLTDTIANRGVFVIAGSGTNAVVQFHVDGNDTYGAAGRVGKCYAYRYTNTTSASPPYRSLTGSPGATPAYFGGGCNISASTKGLNTGFDAVRYGTGAYITAGDSGDPATFDGFATQNDAIANRWGIFTKVGVAYELQGKFVIGQNNAGTATLAYFDDSDVNISVVDTVHSETDFSEFIIDHASTEVYWTNINISALGTNNPGKVTVNNASTVVEITGGTWTSLGITTLEAACVVDGLTWRTSDQVTSNGAALDNCIFDRSSATEALVCDDLDDLDNCTFISDGTGHAVDLGTISATDTMGWSCTDIGYAATDGSTGNETILVSVATSQTLTINVAAGYSTPTVYNTGAGTVSVVSGQVTTTVKVVDIDSGSAIQNANVYVLAGAGGPLTEGTVIIGTSTLTDVDGEVSDTRSLGGDQPITGRVRRASPGFGTLYKTSPIAGTINSASGVSITVQMIKDE